VKTWGWEKPMVKVARESVEIVRQKKPVCYSCGGVGTHYSNCILIGVEL
jgi:hypothetical protein